MNASDNLWGELPTAEAIRTPVVILREQATKLTELTNGVLQGEVTTTKSSTDNKLRHRLNIVAPALDGYRFSVLLIVHSVLAYPVAVYDSVNSENSECDDEGEFVIYISSVLSSSAVHKAIGAMLAQSKAESAFEL